MLCSVYYEKIVVMGFVDDEFSNLKGVIVNFEVCVKCFEGC